MEIRHYTVLDAIYRNADFVIHCATNREENTHLLLKSAQAPSRPETDILLQREYQLLLQLNSSRNPALLMPLALEHSDVGRVLLLEDFNGMGLERYLGQSPLDLTHFFPIALQLVDALDALHQQGYRCNALSPADLLIEPGSLQIKLADISRAGPSLAAAPLTDCARLTLETLAYIAPEQTGRMQRDIDQRSDFYALGACLYRMLTGQAMFQAHDALGMIHSHIAQQPLPPAQCVPGLPPVLSHIVMKLLAKNPEDRYQSSHGLRSDLLAARQHWRAGPETHPAGAGAPFVAGDLDRRSQLRIPDRGYGQQAQRQALLASLAAARQGAAELVLVSGVEGVGKSHFVHEVLQTAGAATKLPFLLVSGSYDQRDRNIPYHGLIEALRQLLRQLLTENAQAMSVWQQQLQHALGGNGQVIAAILPEIHWLIGGQPALPALAPNETRNRFRLVFQRFLSVFTRPEKPLVIFLDELQWADSASLQLINDLLGDSDSQHLLIIAACRTAGSGQPDTANAAGPQHDDAWRGFLRGHEARLLPLQPWQVADIQALLCDTFDCPVDKTLPLAKVLHGKTGGLSFLVKQLLGQLHAKQLIYFDDQSWQWAWRLPEVEQMPIHHSAVTLMLEKIRQLSPETQQALKLAAVAGATFSQPMLLSLGSCSEAALEQALQMACDHGLIAPLAERRADEPQDRAPAGALYRFAHKRIQQAAYTLLNTDERCRGHRLLGLRLLQQATAEQLEQQLFGIVNHLNAGQAGDNDGMSALTLAQLNLRAGVKAFHAIAYETAIVYLAAGMAVLENHAPLLEHNYALSFELQLYHAQAMANTSQLAKAQVLFQRLLQQARGDYDKAVVCEHYSIALQNAGDAPSALQIALDGLALFGILFPQQDSVAERLTHAAFSELTQPGVIRKLGALPKSGAEDMLIDRLYDRCIISTYFTAPQRLGLIISQNVKHVLHCGLSPESSVALAWFAMLLGMVGQKAESFEFGAFALQVARQFDDPLFSSKTELLAHAQSLCWQSGFSRNEADLEQAFSHCHEVGDLQYASYSILSVYIASLAAGDDYQRILHNARRWHDYCEKYVPLELGQAKIRLQQHQRLMGMAEDSVDAEAILADYVAEQNWTDVSESLVELARTACLLGDYEASYRYCQRAEKLLEKGAAGNLLLIALFHQAAAIASARRYAGSEDAAERQKLAGQVTEHLARLQAWAELSPHNFRAYQQLAAAEWARAQQQFGSAVAAYAEAILHAQTHGQQLLAGWANQLLADLYQTHGLELAHAHYSAARRDYLRCAADGMLGALPGAYGQRPAEGQEAAPGQHDGRLPANQQLDMATLMQAAQAIAGEIVLERLIERIMHCLLECAGAQQGALLLQRNDVLQVRALANNGAVRVLAEDAPATEEHINRAIVDFVARTGEAVVLSDAALAGPFSQDRWIQQRQIRSVLCIPLLLQRQLLGMIYLENNLLCGAFTHERIGTLEWLASQAAIALENASLYSNLQAEQLASLQLNESLEQRVNERTADLARSLLEQQALLDNALVGIAFVQDRIILRCNASFEAMFGYSSGELIGQPTRLLYQNDEQYEKPGGQPYSVVHQGSRFLDDVQYRRKDGELIWCTSQAKLYAPDDSTQGVVWVVQDISARKVIEQALASAKRQAEEANASKSMFLANMSHEIRTPMNAIIGLSHLALKTELTGQQRDYLGKIHRAGSSLLEVINDILDFSKMEAGKLHLDHTPFRLDQLLDDVATIVGHGMEHKPLQLRFDIAEDVPLALAGDPLRLGQILGNLVNNAVKFTEQGEVQLQAALQHGSGDEVILRFTVRDTGIGMSEEQLGRLFQAFTQADGSTTRKYGGSGLGLTIAKRLVELMEGSIEVSSAPGQGSRFSFTARLQRAQQAAALEHANSPATDTPLRFPGLRVLLVEDNPINQQIACELLAHADISVDVADNGQLALDRLHAGQRYDLVLMDLQMPVMDGFAATAAIRQQTAWQDLPIIAMTAHALASERQRCLDMGMNDHIAKPVDLQALFRAIARCLQPASAEPRMDNGGAQAATPPLLDPDAALRRLGGKQDFYRKMLAKFVASQALLAQQIGSTLADGQREEAERMAHSCRGAAASLGAMQLAAAAGELEDAIRRQQNEASRLHSFAAALGEALAAIGQLLAASSAISKASPSRGQAITEG